MNAKHPVKDFILRVVWCALLGSFMGLLWGSGVFELISRHHRTRRNYWHQMTADRYLSNLGWFSFYGFLGGVVFGVFIGIWALLNPATDSSSEKEEESDPESANDPERAGLN